MKKIIALVMILSVITAVLAACSDESKGEVTLESIKSALTEAGYQTKAIMIEEYRAMNPLLKNAAGGFYFDYNGSHGLVEIPVYEFNDKESADEYAKAINGGGDYLAVTDDKFLTLADTHGHGEDEAFLKKLISGKSIK